jgi:hypothetical protein
MSKSVRIPDATYKQIEELKQHGYESITNVVALAVDRFYRQEMPTNHRTALDLLSHVQYERSFEVWARSPHPQSEARYVRPFSEKTYILKDQGWMRLADGIEIGDYINEYCEGIPEEDRAEFVEEAVERFLEDSF